ncbi:MAG: AraC family transcriptional regulator [Bacteroidota bacterium]
MAIQDNSAPRGILHSVPITDFGTFARYTPSTELLCSFVEHYWSIRWSVPEPQMRENLPHPSIHIVVERNKSGVFGVVSGKFIRTLEGTGWVFGIKFKPGAFRPLFGASVAELTDRIVPLHELFGPDGTAYEETMLSLTNDDDKVACAEHFLSTRLPEPDEQTALIGRIVDEVMKNKQIMKVEDISERFDIGVRTLQRLFNDYVGIPPKWIIKRYRMFEAVDAVNSGAETDWTQLALELGYFDQAHFIKDFKQMVGRSPGEYRNDPR